MNKRKIVSQILCFVLIISISLFYYAVKVSEREQIFLGDAKALTEQTKFQSILNFDRFVNLPDRKREFVLHFWATWCPTCIPEINKILAYAKNNPKKIFVLSAVNDKLHSVIKMLKQFQKVPSNVYFVEDQEGLSINLGTSKLPETYFFNKEGEVLNKVEGAYTW